MPHIPAPASYQILGLFVLLIASITFVCIKLKIHQFSFKGLFRGIDRKDILLMSLITIPYIALSFVHYGDRFKQGHWFGDIESKTLTIQLTKPVPIKQLHYYIGLASGVLEVSAETESGHKFIVGKTDADNVKLPIVFRWISFNFIESNPIRNIYIKIKKPVIEIKQLAIIDGNYNYLNNAAYSLVSSPFDKRDDMIDLTANQKPPHIGSDDFWMTMAVSDEIYYATSAFQLLNHLPPYVIVHPHLGMLLIGIGILIFGMNPFGWRFISLLSGILMLPAIYIFAKKLSGKRSVAIFSCLLFTFDFMHYSISKGAFIDSIVTLFVLVEYVALFGYIKASHKNCHWRERFSYLFFCGIFFSLSVSTKWSAFFSLIAIIISVIYYELIKKQFSDTVTLTKFLLLITIFILIPFTFYSLTYIPEYLAFLDNNFFIHLINYHKLMLNYHLKEVVGMTNTFTSKWWAWPLDIRPLTLYFNSTNLNRTLSTIFLMGNPAIWWFCIVCFFVVLVEQLCSLFRITEKSSLAKIFILLIISSQYFPYALFKRGTFIYYLYTVTPYMCILIGLALSELWMSETKSLRKFVLFYFLLVIAMFIGFFPILSGIESSAFYITKFLLWYKTWTLS